MADLITPARAGQSATLATLHATNPAYLASLISAASDVVRRQCRRQFALAAFTEYRSGGIYMGQPLRLREFPVTEITRVAGAPRAALRVQNVDAQANQRATVETTPTALRVVRIASANLFTTDLLYANYPTIGVLTSAVNALGGGWSAIVRNALDAWPSADLRPLQGAVSALAGGRDLEIYSEDYAAFSAGAGCLAPDGFAAGLDSGCDAAVGWRLDDQTGELYGRFPVGTLNIRIDYTAGFALIPPAVQEAAVQMTQDLYQASLVNNTLKKAVLGASSIELKTTAGAVMSPKVRMLLAPFIDHAKVIARD